jgi:hypothetical protein
MLSRLSQKMSKSVKPFVFVDFDETISVMDTIGLLGQVGVEAHDSRIPWSFFVQSYMDDYNRVKHNLQAQQHQCVSSSLTHHVTSLDGFRHVEQASLARVSDSGILGGLSRHQWQQAGANKVKLQTSVQSTLLNQVEPNRLYIVSLNWCKDWIRGALLLGHDGDSNYDHYDLKDDHLICNDLGYDPTTQLSTGVIQPTILNTSDKFRQIQSILQLHQRDDASVPKSVYIGDSVGDLLPLGK